METYVNTIPMMEKEQIPALRFGHDDVLTEPEARRKRMWDLNRAATLGNGYRGKVEITFQAADGEQHRVDTTVWAVDDRFMTLKAGCAIPVTSIIGIEFF